MAVCRQGIYVEYSVEYSKCRALNGKIVSTVDDCGLGADLVVGRYKVEGVFTTYESLKYNSLSPCYYQGDPRAGRGSCVGRPHVEKIAFARVQISPLDCQ
eukprot:4201114-Pyramimonas_sp.AAC.1